MSRTLLRNTTMLLMLLAVVSPVVLYPAPAAGARTYNDVQKEIQSKKARLKRVKKLADVTLNDIHKINMELMTVSRETRKYRAMHQKTQKDLQTVKKEIEEITGKLDTRKGLMKRKLRAMYRYGRYGDALLVLGASEDLDQLQRRWRYLEALTLYEQEAVKEYRADLAVLKARHDDLRMLQERLQREAKEVLERESDLSRKKKEKERILASVRKEKSSYERIIRELRKTSARMEKMIGSPERSMGYAGKGFRGRKGRLRWPVLGTVAIPYGTQKDPKFHTPVFRNGIYIEARDRTVAKAVSGGKVVYADWFKGYGQLVIVNHGQGYHSLYANLSEIFLKTGDIIKEDTEIGRVGTSGLIDRPSLYFEIRYKGKPLNPSQWLKRR